MVPKTGTPYNPLYKLCVRNVPKQVPKMVTNIGTQNRNSLQPHVPPSSCAGGVNGAIASSQNCDRPLPRTRKFIISRCAAELPQTRSKCSWTCDPKAATHSEKKCECLKPRTSAIDSECIIKQGRACDVALIRGEFKLPRMRCISEAKEAANAASVAHSPSQWHFKFLGTETCP